MAWIACLWPCAALNAEQITVGEGGITTIQDAVAAALGNLDVDDTILIPPGTYNETVLVDFQTTIQESLAIERAGKKGVVTIVGATGSAITLRAAKETTLRKLTLQSASAFDAVSALRIDTSSSGVVCRQIKGVAGDDFGVVVAGANNIGCRFENCDFSGMSGMGFLLDGSAHELIDCTADDCGLNGLVFSADALLGSATSCTFAASGGTNSLQPGYVTLRGNGQRLIECDVSGAGGDGVWADGNGHVIVRSDSSDNVGVGFHLDDSSILLLDCSASGNAIGVDGGGLTATIDGGNFSKNLSHGIDVTEGGTTVLDAVCKSNGGDGIHVAVGAVGTLVRGCDLIKNALEGVVVEGSLSWIDSNTSRNGDSFVDLGTGNGGRDNLLEDGGTNDF